MDLGDIGRPKKRVKRSFDNESLGKQLTFKDKINRKFMFGKYKGEKFGGVVLGDREYAEFISCCINTKEDPKYKEKNDLDKAILKELIKNSHKIYGLVQPVKKKSNFDNAAGTFPFGKYKGERYRDIFDEDHDYFLWGMSNISDSGVRGELNRIYDELTTPSKK